MKTRVALFPSRSLSITIILALTCLLFGTVKSRAQAECSFTTVGTNSYELSQKNCFSGLFTWGINAEPASSDCSYFHISQCNYYPNYVFDAGGVVLTITALSSPQGGTQTYTVWRQNESNVTLDNNKVTVIVMNDVGQDITSQCTIDTSGFAGPGAPNGASGTVTITWPVSCPGINITGHPADQSVNAGETATYTVTATGSGLTYQWRKNTSNIADGPTGNGSTYSGATSNVLTIANAAVADAALASAGYNCVVTTTDGNCSVVSAKAALNVQGGQGNCTNNIVGIVDNLNSTFTLTFAGLPNAEYFVMTSTNASLPMSQWTVLIDSTNIASGSGTWAYTTAATTLPPQQFYRAVATAPCP